MTDTLVLEPLLQPIPRYDVIPQDIHPTIQPEIRCGSLEYGINWLVLQTVSVLIGTLGQHHLGAQRISANDVKGQQSVQDVFEEESLRERGFEGFVPFHNLQMTTVPAKPGIYTVLRSADQGHAVLDSSGGGHFKSKNPTADPATLRLRLRLPTALLYVGKADSGSRGTRGLRTRINELARFGKGEPVGHWGGRYLWQLSNSHALRVAWLPVEGTTAREAECSYLDEFFTLHGQLPFANLRR